jgi:hypothetical protein
MTPSLRFRKYNSESQDDLKSRVLRALRHKKTGKLLIGRRGDSHFDIEDRWIPKDSYDFGSIPKPNKDYDRGYHDPLTKKFHHTTEVGFDTPDLMTKVQRMRKFSTESKSSMKRRVSCL